MYGTDDTYNQREYSNITHAMIVWAEDMHSRDDHTWICIQTLLWTTTDIQGIVLKRVLSGGLGCSCALS